MLRLPSPRDGVAITYLWRDDGLQEVNWFKQPFTSWFVGNSVVEGAILPLYQVHTLTTLCHYSYRLPGWDQRVECIVANSSITLNITDSLIL